MGNPPTQGQFSLAFIAKLLYFKKKKNGKSHQ